MPRARHYRSSREGRGGGLTDLGFQPVADVIVKQEPLPSITVTMTLDSSGVGTFQYGGRTFTVRPTL